MRLLPSHRAEMLFWEQAECWQLTHRVACATFACCVMGHRTAWKTSPPQKGSSNQEELFHELAQPSPAQMLACHTPITLRLCLL